MAALLVVAGGAVLAQTRPDDQPAGEALALRPTNHPRLPNDLEQLWMVPEDRAAPPAAQRAFAAAVKLYDDASYARALATFAQASQHTGVLGPYAQYYEALTELRQGHTDRARSMFQALQASKPAGYIVEASALQEAECDETLGDHAAALAIYERLSKAPSPSPDDILMRMGRAAKAAGDNEKAAGAFASLVYQFPLSDLSALAATELEGLPNVQPIEPGSQRYRLELGRAERLFGSKHYAEARTAFEPLRQGASGDDKELIGLRMAECDYFLKRPRIARDAVRPYVEHASRQGEALFFYAIATRDLGDADEYTRTIHRIVAEFPTQTWAEEGLNNLATYYILQDDDDAADATFKEMYEKFPKGRYAERAAWKIGWRAYRDRRYADAARSFEHAAADFPRSDYRPSWLYWSGRAHDAAGDKAVAQQRYTLVATDYLNTYYGRLAIKHLEGPVPHRALVVDVANDGDGWNAQPEDGEPPLRQAALPANAAVVRALVGIELYDQAIDELRYAQRAWGNSAAIEATLAWINNRRGDLRAGITAMKRAYPQYMAAGGEQLPTEVLKVMFPVNYWPLIRRYSTAHQLDPYMIAALIAQESTFTADVKSAANAYGLMQLLPSTGRHYARVLKMKRFSVRMLTTADSNLKMGTAYFADLVKQFGAPHYALASYNAGETRVARWISERPNVDRDEFIDDIPFPETQNYVKRILGAADDYRRLYGADARVDAEEEDEVRPASVRRPSAPAAKKAVAPTSKKKAPAHPTKKKSTHKKPRKTT